MGAHLAGGHLFFRKLFLTICPGRVLRYYVIKLALNGAPGKKNLIPANQKAIYTAPVKKYFFLPFPFAV